MCCGGHATPGSGFAKETPRRASGFGECRKVNLSWKLNDRLSIAEECQTPLVEAGLDILNAIKHSIIGLEVNQGCFKSPRKPLRQQCLQGGKKLD
jgi:hypothetical protein